MHNIIGDVHFHTLYYLMKSLFYIFITKSFSFPPHLFCCQQDNSTFFHEFHSLIFPNLHFFPHSMSLDCVCSALCLSRKKWPNSISEHLLPATENCVVVAARKSLSLSRRRLHCFILRRDLFEKEREKSENLLLLCCGGGGKATENENAIDQLSG